MPAQFDTAAIVRGEKTSAAEKATIAAVVDTVKHLNKLIEDARPTDAATHRKAKDAAVEVLKTNPTPATVAAYKAALGAYLNPEAVFQPVYDELDNLIGVELQKLIPIAKRIHASAAASVRDPKRFNIEAVEAIPDIAERGQALTDFAAGHSAALVAFVAEADDFDNERSAHRWLALHGFCEAIWG